MKIKNDTVCLFQWCSDWKTNLIMHKIGIVKLSLLPSIDWELLQSYKDSPDGRGEIEVPARFKLWLRWWCFAFVWCFETKIVKKEAVHA